MTQSVRPVGPGDHVFLVDGSSFVFRAYFQSIRQDPKYNYRSDKLPVGAVRLFATKVLQFLRDGAAGIKPTHLAIIFDKSENSFRRELYPLYKAHRPDPPPDLVPQFPLMRATVAAFGLTPIEQDRYEADDLIATYATQARAKGADVLIVSADKDLMQLVGPGVAMFDPASGDREERRIGPAEVVDYFGLGADKVVDIQALAGDSTDNVPGAPGIGVKTAAQLIGEYGDLDTLLARAGEIKQPKRRETLTDPESVKLIRLSKQLVKLVTDVEVAAPLDALGTPKLEAEPLIAFLKAMEFTAITKRVADLAGLDADAIEPDPRFVGPGGWRGRNGEPAAPEAAASPDAPAPRRARRRRVRARDGADAHAADARRRARGGSARHCRSTSPLTRPSATPRRCRRGSTALATPGSSPSTPRRPRSIRCRRGWSAFRSPSRRARPATFRSATAPASPACSRAAACCPGQIGEAEAIALLKPLLEDPGVLKVGQNVKFDWHVFARRGVEVAPYDDTMLISYALDSGATNDGHGMDALSERWLGHKTISFSAKSPARDAISSASPASRSTRRPHTPPRTPT